MSTKEMKLLHLLCEEVGIKTMGELDAFKKKTHVTTSAALIKKLALCVAFDQTLKEVLENEHL